MRSTNSLLLCFAAIVGFCGQAGADDGAGRKDSDFVLRNFRFKTGDVVPELRIHYVTLGTPKRDPSGHVNNAVLLLHGTSTSGGLYLGPNPLGTNLAAQLLAEGQPLDVAHYYLIVPDSIGHGRSSKPSDGLGVKFPHYGYDDTIEAEHRLLTEELGIDHLRLILGTSMGGMQTWMWGEKYPDLMDALLPIASQPSAIVGRNFLWRHLITEAIRNDPDWGEGNYVNQPSRWRSILPIWEVMLMAPARTQRTAPTREKSIELFNRWVAVGKSYDANDILYQWESSWDYNPAPDLTKIKAKLLAVNFSDDLLNPPETGVMDTAIAKVANGRSVIIPASGESFGHLGYFHPEIWKPYLIELLKSLP
jgi:homoserine O-acetyltransferase